MELFVDSSYEGLFLDLFSFYLQQQQNKAVSLINLSSGALKAISKGSIILPGIPCLIQEDGSSLLSAPFIAEYLAGLVGARDVFFGKSKVESQ